MHMHSQGDHVRILKAKLSCVGIAHATKCIIKYNKLCVGQTHEMTEACEGQTHTYNTIIINQKHIFKKNIKNIIIILYYFYYPPLNFYSSFGQSVTGDTRTQNH